MSGKMKQFPTPGELTDEQPVAWRSVEDMLQIANAANGWDYKNLCKTVQDWVETQATVKKGWSVVYFPLKYPSKTQYAGVVFVK